MKFFANFLQQRSAGLDCAAVRLRDFAASTNVAADAAAPVGVSADDVIACIEMILGRTPDAALIEHHLQRGFADRVALGNYMISTDEFRTRYSAMVGNANNIIRPASIFLGDRVLTFTHRGHVLFLVPQDIDLTPLILLGGTFEPHVEETIVSSIRPGDIVIDIGANVGYHTLAMAAAVGPDGQVHAFEANPDVMRLLKATVLANRLSWVSLYDNAALDRPGTITLQSAPGHYGSGNVAVSGQVWPEYSIRVDVAGITLDTVFADRIATADLIHMDIEGSEPLALRGAQALIERSPKLKIITEWSVGMMSARADVSEYVAWLVGQQFRFWLIEPGAKLKYLDPQSLVTLPHCDLFLSRENPNGES